MGAEPDADGNIHWKGTSNDVLDNISTYTKTYPDWAKHAFHSPYPPEYLSSKLYAVSSHQVAAGNNYPSEDIVGAVAGYKAHLYYLELNGDCADVSLVSDDAVPLTAFRLTDPGANANSFARQYLDIETTAAAKKWTIGGTATAAAGHINYFVVYGYNV